MAQRSTRWSIVYDQTQKLVRFRTDLHPAIRTVNLSALGFGCSIQARMLDVNAKVSGDVTALLRDLHRITQPRIDRDVVQEFCRDAEYTA